MPTTCIGTQEPALKPTINRVKKSRPRGRATYVADRDLTCALCSTVVPAGEWFYRGLTKEPQHRQCVRLGIRPPVAEPRRIVGSPIRLASPICPWCDNLIEAGQRKTSKDGHTWHKDCYLTEHRRM